MALPGSASPDAAAALRAIRNYYRYDDRLSSAGHPTLDQFALVHDVGFEAVINLLPDERTDAEEAETVRALGIEYVHIPVVWANPTESDVDRFFEVMDRLHGRRVFVHCAVNMRASAFVYMYRVCRLGHDLEDAEADLHDIWTPEGVWERLIETVRTRCAAS